MSKTYEASFWPNNQPPILLGFYDAETQEEAVQKVCVEHDISENDPLWVALAGPLSPINRWREGR